MPSNNYVGNSSYRDESFHTSNSPTNMPSLTPASTLDSSVDASPSRYAAGDEVLDDTVFPEFKNNEESNLEEHQREDPLGVDMWKFYRKQSRLPDAGRMENMTWRMMAINLRKVQQQGQRALQTPTRRNSDPNRHHSTTPQAPASTNPHPAGAQVRRIAIPRGRTRLRRPSASEQPGLDARSFPVPAADDPYQYGYNPDTTPQMPPTATNVPITNSQKQHVPFPSPPPPPHSSGYDFRNGPRGHIQVPPAPNPEPQPAAHHPRHVSLASQYLHRGDPIDCGFQAPANHRQRGAVADVAPWDPGWADEAFGGPPLYGPAARAVVVKREVDVEESAPSFDAPGLLDDAEWLGSGKAITRRWTNASCSLGARRGCIGRICGIRSLGLRVLGWGEVWDINIITSSSSNSRALGGKGRAVSSRGESGGKGSEMLVS
ncbi:hypothetical protein B0J12DRAFT_296820 [Macrophomina phaseolina]|uniref:Nitrogen regulatory protein areA GATA-like domain-containing protein n=1 Tax=Macrophomina phaseolina TaxID=35725 RepID=A0ABQ8GNX6_9PEZI|nr:hypothetical protein B0J12DRAFT_296820 [Macrophomina phaseolina]